MLEAWQDETVPTCTGPVNIVAISAQKSQNTDLSLHVTKFSCSTDIQHLTSFHNYILLLHSYSAQRLIHLPGNGLSPAVNQVAKDHCWFVADK